jgi:hypothetical protein
VAAEEISRWDPANAKTIAQQLEADVCPWIGGEPVGSLKKDALLRVLERIELRGALETAHRVRQYSEASQGDAAVGGSAGCAGEHGQFRGNHETFNGVRRKPVKSREPAANCDRLTCRAILRL